MGLDVAEREGTVDLGLERSEPVEGRSVEDEDAHGTNLDDRVLRPDVGTDGHLPQREEAELFTGGIEVDPDIAPSMIDEFPVLFVAAAMAKGATITSGLEELRVKESDRLSAMAAALKLAGAKVQEREDGLLITGSGGEPLPGGGTVTTHLDHRIAMSMAVAGLASETGVEIDSTEPIATSFPNFTALIEEASA